MTNPAERVTRCLERIRSPAGAALNAYIATAPDQAAERADATSGPLRGMTLCVKDVIDAEGFPTTGGVKAVRRLPERDAAVVAALRAAGATVVGKGHTNQLAYGIDGDNPDYGPAHNPHDRERITGGSSSGPAAAIADGLADIGLGTDTSGSLRVPGALCGVAALRPTHGRLPLDGVLALNPTFDTVGPMAASVADLAAVWAVLAGEGAQGSATRVTVLEDFVDGCHPEVLACVERVAAACAELGTEVVRRRTGFLERGPRIHRPIQFREAAESLRPLLGSGFPGVAEEMRERLMEGERIGEADYREAQQARQSIRAELLELMAGGLALLPSVPIPAPRIEEQSVELAGATVPRRLALLSRTMLMSQAGLPVLALPAGTAGGCPTGVQLAGPPGSESTLLAVGERLERALAD